MAEYRAAVRWVRNGAPFVDNRYSRRHELAFDGGVVVRGSSSPHVVRVPFSDPAAVDPEECFVASLSACHMLWFLSIAAGRGFTVDVYLDDASGVMSKDAAGRLAMTQVTLRPRTEFSGARVPDAAEVDAMHHDAHEACFIANSVRTRVECVPSFTIAR
jgi:organic hydroperoxide reductase OsmC/OhrA